MKISINLVVAVLVKQEFTNKILVNSCFIYSIIKGGGIYYSVASSQRGEE